MRRTSFKIAKMDCASEEQLVRMKLEGRPDVHALTFDLATRRLDVAHSTDPATIARELETLDLGASMLDEGPVALELVPGDVYDERRLLWQVLLINLAFFAVEVVAGYFARSMGLVADSLDMLADAVVYGLALYAVGRTARQKGGVALVSGVFQLALALFGVAETVRRFVSPADAPAFGVMIGVSLLALAGNSASLYLLQRSRSREVHMQASMIFTSNDVIANIGVIIAGLLVFATASKWPDLVVGVAIFLLVARGALRILRLSRT